MQSQILISKKKTCTKERLLKTLSAISNLGITYEGEGGRTQGYVGGGYGDGDYEVGTGLRAPDMPFYYKPKTSRRAVLKHLEDTKLITIEKHEEDEWSGFKVTVQGLIILEAYNRCVECGETLGWYKVSSFNRTGERTGYKSTSRNMMCECQAKKYASVPEMGIEKIKSKESV